ncbi:BAG domain-containing protein Samui isoform X2 [Halyomorpha halys]|uniref:BAG domain-containing protein Samui isoform X2 n=1 Tax=Halyomorpha halys TaxID=286706 RepID=UPI0006D5019B|nr:BAG domain-containing protein Samui isoform X2 [Halyomorpha halys]
MSFSFDRPSLRERTRGKPGDEFVEEMLKNLKQKNRKFFDSYPKWKAGFSFDDGLEREGSAGGSSSNLHTHLADLVARHPELADSFVGFLPEELGTKPKESQEKGEVKESAQTSEINKPTQTTTIGTQTGGLESDIKLRNTVPDMQSSTQSSSDINCDERSQRSQSAPPQASSNSSVKQNEEGIRLIPIRSDVPQSGQQIPARPQQQFQNPPFTQQHFQQPPNSQQYQQSSQHFQQNPQQQQSPDQRNHEEKGPTIRHIPIFVEGRDEPILPKDAVPTGMKRGGCQGKAESNPGKRGTQPEEKRQQQQQTTEPPPQPQQAPTHPPSKPDPLTQVADILKEVEELSSRVNEWKGTSRSEKEYIYLDEMLTRNLLKLDNIETEGREEVRTARKDVIRRIQAAISILESKSAECSDQSNQIQDTCRMMVSKYFVNN